MNFIKNCLKGLLIGAGAILPGISSGVLCVIFGIYDKLIKSILDIFKDFKNNIAFLLPYVVGGFLGIILFGNILTFLFDKYPMPTHYSFIGLILGSIPVLIKTIHKKHSFYIHYLLFTFIAFLIGVLCIFLEQNVPSFLSSPNIDFGYFFSSFSQINMITFLFLFTAGFFMSIGIVVPRS